MRPWVSITGQGVVGPGLFAAHGDRFSRGGLGLPQPVALFPGEGEHAVQVGHVAGGRQRGQGHAQHVRRVACVEQVIVTELERGEIARIVARLFLVQVYGTMDVALYPGRDGLDEALLTRRATGPPGRARKGRAFAGASRVSANMRTAARRPGPWD